MGVRAGDRVIALNLPKRERGSFCKQLQPGRAQRGQASSGLGRTILPAANTGGGQEIPAVSTARAGDTGALVVATAARWHRGGGNPAEQLVSGPGQDTALFSAP